MSKLLANQIANFGDDAPIEIKEGLNIPAGKPLQAAGVVGNAGQVLTSTGATIQWVTPFDGDYNSLTGRPTIPSPQVQVDWNSTGGISSILNKPSIPPFSSVVTGTAGSPSLAYNAANGQFTYTPPDLSGFASNANVSNWDAAYGWGDHGTEGYLVATNTDKTNWNTAFGWGDHGTAGYLTSYTETSTFQNVIDRGNTSTSPVYITNKLYFSNNFSTLTDLQAVSATTYHGMFAHVHAEGHGYFAHAGGWTQLLDVGSSIDELNDVDTVSNAPSDGYVLKWEASSNQWKPAPDLVGTSNAGIVLSDLSVTTASAGTPSLSYSNTTGVFTYTPPDLSGYLTTETDPVFSASPAFGITSTNISNWDAAHGWGDHGTEGYLTTETDNLSSVTSRNQVTLTLGGGYGTKNCGSTSNHVLFGGLVIYENDIMNIGVNDRTLFGHRNGAMTWCGDDGSGETDWQNRKFELYHLDSSQNTSTTYALAGALYLKSDDGYPISIGNDTGDIQLGNKSGSVKYLTASSTATKLFHNGSEKLTTTATGIDLGSNNLVTTGKLLYSNNYANLGDLPSATTYHGMFAHVHAEGHGYFGHAGGWTQLLDTGSSINELADVTTGTISTGDVLTWSGSAWAAAAPTGGGGGGGANVTISDTPPGSPSSGDLWWESDTGRLKIRYQDVDSAQWVDTSPPLADATTIGGSGTVTMKASIIPDTNAAYDLGNAEYKIRHLFLSDNSLWLGNRTRMSVGFRNLEDANIGARPTVRFYNRDVNKTPAPIAAIGGTISGCIAYVNATFPGRSGPVNADTLLLTDWTGYWSSLTGAPIGTYGVDDLYPPPFLNGDINPNYDPQAWADAMGFSQNGQERAVTISSDATAYNLADTDTFLRVGATADFPVKIDSIATDDKTFFNMTVWVSQGVTPYEINAVSFYNGSAYEAATQVKTKGTALANNVQAFKITGIKLGGNWSVNIDIG